MLTLARALANALPSPAMREKVPKADEGLSPLAAVLRSDAQDAR
jgi:hypothetical protein